MIHKFKVPPSVLESFLVRVEEGYCRHRNPYHNNLHAADVAQTMHYVLCQTGLMVSDGPCELLIFYREIWRSNIEWFLFQNWLTDLEIFATLVAAIIHDFEHTGTTNNFHVMSGSDTALLYNDRAVLENHHISASFRWDNFIHLQVNIVWNRCDAIFVIIFAVYFEKRNATFSRIYLVRNSASLDPSWSTWS